MKFRNFLRNLLPVCVLAIASCPNAELILDASKTQRGRDFASAFEARFGSVDPNHTWVDGTVGKVTVTTDQAANIVIYGLGRSDGTLLRLKRCVVNGTQEVKYDIPKGCKSVVLRAYNDKFNEYKTLNPSNEYDEAVMTTKGGTRAGSNATTIEEFIASNQPRTRQLIPNVWNAYTSHGYPAPWQTTIPETSSLTAIYRGSDAGDNAGWNFYFRGQDGYLYNVFTWETYNYYMPASLFTSIEDFHAKTGFTSADEGTGYQVVEIAANQKWPAFPSIAPNGDYVSGRTYPAGTYYNYKAYGKRGSWWRHDSDEYGKFYVTSMDISNSTSGTLKDAPDYFKMELNAAVISEIEGIVTPDNQYELLKPFVTDAGFTTLAPGPVSITWFTGVTTTRDYVGYYYTEGNDDEEAMNAADKYLLLDALSGARQKGDTFPLTYYGPDGTGSPSYTFPAGVNIHFFIVHGRGSSTSEPHPHSGYTSWTSGNQNNWLFYDTTKSDGSNENGWTLDAWYSVYSQGGEINNPALNRLYDEHLTPDARIDSDFDGNYIPSMAFNYAGYNVIGFEDTPTGIDLDWNDCTFIVNGNFDIKKYKQQDLAFSMCMEDLGGTDDLDYNDLFMVVTQGYEEITTNTSPAPQTYYSAPKVIIPMVGGTLPLKITFEPENEEPQVLFEDVHAAFGQGLTDVAINTCEPGTYSDNIRNISGEPDYKGTVFTVDFTDGSVVKCANFKARNDAEAEDVSTVFDASRWDADHIASFSILDHIPDFKIWVTYEDGQELCISGPKNLQVGEDVSDAQKIPFAFWFPSTADSEQESEENPETRVLPGYERQFINNALPGFAEWVANQDAYSADGRNNWYNWAWGTNGPVTPGSGNSGGGEEETTKTAILEGTNLTSNVTTNAFGWGKEGVFINPNCFISGATSITFKLTFSNTYTGQLKVVTYNGDHWGTGNNQNAVTECTINVNMSEFPTWTNGLYICQESGSNFVNYLQSVVIESSKE